METTKEEVQVWRGLRHVEKGRGEKRTNNNIELVPEWGINTCLEGRRENGHLHVTIVDRSWGCEEGRDGKRDELTCTTTKRRGGR